MFSRARPHQRTSSTSTTNPVSPLLPSFDFQLQPAPSISDYTDSVPPSPFSPVSEGSISRPRTSHGVAADGQKPAGLQLLPPIPRVASRQSSIRAYEDPDAEQSRSNSNSRATRNEGDSVVSLTSNKLALKARSSLEDLAVLLPLDSRPTTPRGTKAPAADWQQTAADGVSEPGTPKMESSLFPSRRPSAISAQSPAISEPMGRSFVDSRDKPYSQPAQRPFVMHQNHSSPNLMRSSSPAYTSRQPTPIYSSNKNWISPHSSVQNLFSTKTTGSGGAVRPTTQNSSSYTAHSGLSNVVTLGTPYQANAASYPLPQLVRTRPKTPGATATATVAGVSVPTHHTSGTKTLDKLPEPKKKGRLLNPLALLQRRRSGQDSELVVEERAARQAQAQALARQRDVVASGVNKPPPDFDPRIKGKVVHDFSAPRGKRNTFDETDMPLPPQGIQSANSAPVFSSSAYPPRNASLLSGAPRVEGETRRSVHTPIFVEHLSEHPEASRHINSIHAENLENKGFIQRASKHSSGTSNSQESAVLPPFARRSQILDPMQASFYQDEESLRSSDPSSEKERGSTLSSTSEVSPITARSSSHMLDGRASFSPVSPSSTGQDYLPASESSKSNMWQPLPVFGASKPSSRDGTTRPISQLSKTTTPENHRKTVSEVTARTVSVILAPPAVNTVAEGSVESSPVEPAPQTPRTPQEAQGLKPDASWRMSAMPNPAPEMQQPPNSRNAGSSTGSPATPNILDRTADMPTPEHTPEPEPVESIQFKPNKEHPKLVEKRASAVGHSRKSSNVPKHHASNASRFSFQFGSESAAQEQELEEKHRSRHSREILQSIPRGRSPDGDDEDDFFDEDAMDDMDEMEMQAVQREQSVGHLAVPTQSSLYLQQARQALHEQDSDEGSIYDEDNIPSITNEEDIPYSDHPAFRTHSALGNYSRHNSYLQGGQDAYWRGSTIDHYMRDSFMPAHSGTPSQIPALDFNFDFDEPSQERSYPVGAISSAEGFPEQRDNFSMQSNPAAETPQRKDDNPPLPDRGSGNSERNRVLSGMSFGPGPEKSASQNTVAAGEATDGADIDPHLIVKSSSASIDYNDEEDDDTINGIHSTSPTSPDSKNVHSSSPVSPASLSKGLSGSTKNDSIAGITLASPIRNTHTRDANGSSKGSPYSDGRRNGSAGAASFVASPPGSPFGHHDRTSATGSAFHSFAPVSSPSGAFNRMTPEKVGQAGQIARSPMTPPPTAKTNERIGASSKTSSPNTFSTGLGLSMFTGFDFDDMSLPLPTNTPPDVNNAEQSATNSDEMHSPQAAFGTYGHVSNQSQTVSHASWSESSKHSTSAVDLPLEQHVTTTFHTPSLNDGTANTLSQSQVIGNIAPTHNSIHPNHQNDRNTTPYRVNDGEDDMYFDDGNFDQDINQSYSGSIDENAFDDDGFLARPHALGAADHSRDKFSMTATTPASDGPYPTFGLPTASRAQQRLSQMMLEDLPLQAPVEPRYIPQRNPSEDMKRLGLSDHAPPVPVSESNKEAFSRMQTNLQSYHAALAGAANKAAADGRFVRGLSVSTTHSFNPKLKVESNTNRQSFENRSINDDRSIYSNDEDSGNIATAPTLGHDHLKIGRSDTAVSRLTHLTTYSPPRMSFDFGFDVPLGHEDDFFGNDDDLVAAANAEALASDDEGFYGQEFDFYGRPRANSEESQSVNGGFFGEDGDDGLQRNKSSKEPNLTPITERSEFSTRNSFISGQFGPNSAGPYGPHSPALARMSVAPLYENDITSFDELRKLKATAFGDSNSLRTNSNRSSSHSLQATVSPNVHTRPTGSGYFGSSAAPPMQFAYSTDSSGSSNPHISQSWYAHSVQDSPKSAGSSGGMPFSMDFDATPKKNTANSPAAEPVTARKAPPSQANTQSYQTHSRKGSAADSIGYVQEPDPGNNGRPRWVLERRRASDHGQLELIGREVVGWI